MNRNYRHLDTITAVFVAALLISNVTSAAKILDWGVSILGLRLAVDAGTLLFPISYILGDILTEVYGYHRSRKVIWTGFALSALMALTFWLVGHLPGEAQWETYAGQEAYDAILGGVSSGGIIIASLTAYFAGEFSNSYVMAKLKIATRGRWLWVRTISSTLLGEGVDTVFFVLIATYFGVFPRDIALTLIVTNYIFKVGIEALMTPVTYRIANSLKRAENEDFYDYHTDFNPFRVT
jgi:queuosine precursor transporter